MVLVAAFTLRALKQSFFGDQGLVAVGQTSHLPNDAASWAEKLGTGLLIFATVAAGVLSQAAFRSNHARGGDDAFRATMNYLELLQLATPEAIVVAAALLILTIALLTGHRSAQAGVSLTRRGPRVDVTPPPKARRWEFA
jgi:hypothetical protein